MIPAWLRRRLDRARLKDPAYASLFEPGPPDEAVSLDCETTGLDRRRDDIITVAAVKLHGARILTSERFEATIRPSTRINPEAIKIHKLRERDVAMGRAMADVLPRLLAFIGGRPLIGYYLEFDLAMLNRYVRPWLGVKLPNPAIELSGLYYDLKYAGAPPGSQVDLSFAALTRDLGLPLIGQHDALADATLCAMAYLALKDRKARGARIPRSPFTSVTPFSGG